MRSSMDTDGLQRTATGRYRSDLRRLYACRPGFGTKKPAVPLVPQPTPGARRPACPLRCRITPYWIKAAPIGQLAADGLRASRWCPRRAAKGRVVPIACGDGFVVVPFTMR